MGAHSSRYSLNPLPPSPAEKRLDGPRGDFGFHRYPGQQPVVFMALVTTFVGQVIATPAPEILAPGREVELARAPTAPRARKPEPNTPRIGLRESKSNNLIYLEAAIG